MPDIASEQSTGPHYDFSFAWNSSYGHAVELLKRLDLERGAIFDLGCGMSSIAIPLKELGYDYVGVDIDREALERISQRGLEAHELDLGQTDELAGRLLELAGERRVAAVLLLDVIEHMPETRPFLAAVREGLELLGRPPLLVSVPNVTHADVGAKLIFGKWEYTPTGLLDRTHLQFFTSERLDAEARACGLLELGANDFRLRDSDQHFPSDHPALSAQSPIAQTIRVWRDAADPHGETIQFIRAFVPCDVEPRPLETLPVTASIDRRPLTVVVRTQGRRPANLREALTCLAAQTFDDFDVLLMVHSANPEVTLPAVTALVEDFDPTFATRVSIVHVAGGRRARPLNEALARLHSDYVAFLDDDDMVMANWVESFVEAGGDGAIVRSVAAVRRVSAPLESQRVPFVIQSSLEFRYDLDFDLVHHLWGNETPICTFAVPTHLIEVFDLRFDEGLPVLEDWEFLVRCALLAPVRDTRKVTSIYQMWLAGESSASLHEVELWQATQQILQDRTNQRPLVLPAGSAGRLIEMCEQHAAFDAVRGEMLSARDEAWKQSEKVEQLVGELDVVWKELEKVRLDLMITITSRRWRLLGPPAWVVSTARGACRGLMSRVAKLFRRT
jgi:SAM-dependent methyltransferase